jgi:hypothetical protein
VEPQDPVIGTNKRGKLLPLLDRYTPILPNTADWCGRDRWWVLLSPGCDLRRADGTNSALFRCQPASGVCHPDVDRNDSWLRQFILALLFSPETRGKQLVPDVVLA